MEQVNAIIQNVLQPSKLKIELAMVPHEGHFTTIFN